MISHILHNRPHILHIAKPVLALVVCIFCALGSRAEVTVDAKLDSTRMVVGQQSVLTLSVNCGRGQKIQFPVLNDGDMVTGTLEVVRTLPADTVVDEEKGRMHVAHQYTVTSFDTAHFQLPAFAIQVDQQEYTTKQLKLQVYEFPVDTTNVKKYYPIKDIQEAPFSWQDWKWIVFTSLFAIFLFFLSGLMYTWLCNGVPVIRLLRRKPKLPPHTVAMLEINDLKHKKQLAIDDSKAYYTLLTDALRTYIRDRYNFNALEMTSTEIIARLQQENDQEALDELRDLFQTADLAKFAKYNALVNENDAHLLTAIDYVNRTKLEIDPNAKEEAPKLSADDKRNIALKWVLRVLITLSLLTSFGILTWDIYRLMCLVG